MESNQEMAALLGNAAPATLSDRSAPGAVPKALSATWHRTGGGAWLLPELLDGYHGSLDDSDPTGLEGRVNGRGVNADGLPDAGTERVIGLLHRSFAWARAGLVSAAATPGHPGAVAYVSLSLPDDEDEDDDVPATANVTFCACHPEGRPYIRDVTGYQGGPIAALTLADFTRSD
ncbi:hypothetical protein [Kitasatospora sp. NRRL B-11411]|uniref:hypothetical protein n=1 Tax=Kitasatospora sp. NRRL B-11411 TaxID=1463822 RepID=UPI0012FF0073|nr:hypothetical protein [Kitasatospora sp. NRRL B-11411]